MAPRSNSCSIADLLSTGSANILAAESSVADSPVFTTSCRWTSTTGSTAGIHGLGISATGIGSIIGSSSTHSSGITGSSIATGSSSTAGSSNVTGASSTSGSAIIKGSSSSTGSASTSGSSNVTGSSSSTGSSKIIGSSGPAGSSSTVGSSI